MIKGNWLLKALGASFLSAVATFLVQRYGEFIMTNIGNLVKSFLVTFSPVLIGLLVFFIYWITVDYIKQRRFNKKVETWIGFFSYGDRYHDLKGKIYCYIRDELNETTKKEFENLIKRVDKLEGSNKTI